MATTRKPAARKKAEPPECSTCKGTGEVATAVRVGRKRRTVGQQNGLCLRCFGSGHAD